MLKSLTTAQQKVFNYYEQYVKDNGHPPTYDEAGSALDVSPSVVYSHIKNLEKKGYLQASSKKEGRGVQIFGTTSRLPVVGTVACGEPIQIIETRDEFIDVPKAMLKGSGPFYALYASGYSMINANISDKDTLIIRKQDDVDDGDIAVVALGDTPDDESGTLKRVYKKRKSIMLKPENDNFEPIWVDDCHIRGKLVGVISMEDN
jgi:repressor LexA